MASTALSTIVTQVEHQLHANGRSTGRDVIYAFNLIGEGGGKFYVAIKGGYGSLHLGSPPVADCWITMATADGLAIVQGRMNAMAAVFTRRIRIDGDLAVAARLGELLRPR